MNQAQWNKAEFNESLVADGNEKSLVCNGLYNNVQYNICL